VVSYIFIQFQTSIHIINILLNVLKILYFIQFLVFCMDHDDNTTQGDEMGAMCFNIWYCCKGFEQLGI
jgi:hypothetical protein